MTVIRKLGPILLGMALGCCAVMAEATPSVTITGVGTRNAAGDMELGSAVDLGNNRALLITGYMVDPVTKDVGHNGKILLESMTDQSIWAVPVVNRLWGAKMALQSVTAGKLDPAYAAAVNDAGFLASADAYTLPPGTYNVKSVVAVFGNANMVNLPVTDALSITIPEGRTTTTLQLSASDGQAVSFSPKVMPYTGDIRLDSYGVQRPGAYRLSAPAYDKWGNSGGDPAQFTLNYQRPLLKLDVSNPAAEGFIGFPQNFALNNPLNGEKLSGALTGEASIDAASTPSAMLNGKTITGDAKVAVDFAAVANTVGSGSQYSAAASADGAGGKVRVFINAPDAPDVLLTVANWNPDVGIVVKPSKTTYAVGVEQASIAASRVSGSHCGLVFDAPEPGATTAIKFGANTVYCAVRWTEKPSGLVSYLPFPNLYGKLSAVGTLTGAYETGVLWQDPTTKQVVFSKSANHALTINAVEPVAPTIKFLPDAALIKAGATNYLAYAGSSLPGGVQVSSPYVGMGIRITTDDGTPGVGSTNTNRYYKPLAMVGSVVGVQRNVKVEAFYTGQPALNYSKTFTFDIVPRRQVLFLQPQLSSVSTMPLTINGKFGSPNSDGTYMYDPVYHGNWSIQLATANSKGVLTPMGAPITTIAPDGSISFDVGYLTPGVRTFTAVATQTDAPAGTTSVVRSRNTAINTHNGAAIPLASLMRPEIGNGMSPLTVQFGVFPSDRARLTDVGLISFETSDDGANFAPVLKADGTPLAGNLMFFMSDVLTGNNVKFYRATVKNRWSGEMTTSEAKSAQSFTTPTIAITAPRYTVVDHPITATAVVKDVDPSTLAFRWTVYYGRYDTKPTTVDGEQTFTINPVRALPDLIIKVEARDKAAPDNPRALRSAETGINVLAPVLTAPTIVGPTIVETSKNYTWTATQRSLFPTGVVTDIAIKSHWVLPDGTNSTDNPVTYTYKETDTKVVRYESWIEGYPTSLVGSNLTLSPWTYVWPEWKMATSIVNLYAPARVSFNAGLVNPAVLSSLHGEQISYDWVLPPSATVASQSAGLMVADFSEVGTYHATVNIRDTRGNVTTLTSPSFTVVPPKPLTFNFTLSSGDRWNRPPGPVLARTVVTGVPTGDAVRGVVFYIDGVQTGAEVASGANFNLPEPGTYSIRALMTTVKGNTAESTQSITLALGDNPACNLTKNGNGSTTLWFVSACSVQRGTITKYTWKVNGAPNTVTANSISFAASQIATVRTVEVTATTDKGQVGGAIYDMVTGTVTPTGP